MVVFLPFQVVGVPPQVDVAYQRGRQNLALALLPQIPSSTTFLHRQTAVQGNIRCIKWYWVMLDSIVRVTVQVCVCVWGGGGGSAGAAAALITGTAMGALIWVPHTVSKHSLFGWDCVYQGSLEA